jgi:uncharacterized protein (PEP-CTERM system associated)
VPGGGAFTVGTLTAPTQTPASGGLRIVPYVSASETLTDNYQPGTNPAASDAITQFSAGLTLTGRSGRFDGYIDYALTGIVYARHSESNQRQQSLDARVHSEFIEKQGFLDASASISRQSISAFGTQSADPALINANSTEVRTLRVSPQFRGQMPGLWDYQAMLDYGISRSGAGGVGDSSGTRASLQLNRAQQGRVSLSILGQSSILKYVSTRDTTDDRIDLTSKVDIPEADLQASVSGGYERSNVVTATDQSQATWGFGLNWAPSPRTRFDATYDKRQFGPTHTLNFETRSARTVWRFTSSQAISTIEPNTGTTFYDLYYALFSSLEPDPIKRSQLVSNFLQQNGISANGAVPGSFLPRSTTFSNQQSFSAGWLGVRDTITLTGGVSDHWQADPLAQVGGDLANGQHVYQNTLSLNLSHRLTPQSSLNVIGTVNDSHGSLQSPSTRLKTVYLQWSTVPGWKTTLTATLRHSDFESPVNPYRENAAIVAVTLRF